MPSLYVLIGPSDLLHPKHVSVVSAAQYDGSLIDFNKLEWNARRTGHPVAAATGDAINHG
jgi:hypothetical protein